MESFITYLGKMIVDYYDWYGFSVKINVKVGKHPVS